MKGQMFVVTMVFLVSLIFVVQQSLFQYAAMDTINTFSSHDIYMMNNLRELFNETLQLSSDCSKATTNLNDLGEYINDQAFMAGYTVDIGNTTSSIECSNWGTSDPVVRLELKIVRGVETESEAVYYLYR